MNLRNTVQKFALEAFDLDNVTQTTESKVQSKRYIHRTDIRYEK